MTLFVETNKLFILYGEKPFNRHFPHTCKSKRPSLTGLPFLLTHLQRWDFIKENKKVRKKERGDALDQEGDKVMYICMHTRMFILPA